MSFYSDTSSYSIPDWGIGLCDALPTEGTQNFWNGVGNTTYPWWWKNTYDNGGQVGKEIEDFFVTLVYLLYTMKILEQLVIL